MRTVKWMKEELAKFPDDAVCFACDGVLVMEWPGERFKQGGIQCSELEDTEPTELLPERGNKAAA